MGPVITGAVLAAIVLFCLWHVWPQSWTSLTTEEKTRLSAWLDMADLDWNAENDATQAIHAALNQYPCRRRFSSLIPPEYLLYEGMA